RDATAPNRYVFQSLGATTFGSSGGLTSSAAVTDPSKSQVGKGGNGGSTFSGLVDAATAIGAGAYCSSLHAGTAIGAGATSGSLHAATAIGAGATSGSLHAATAIGAGATSGSLHAATVGVTIAVSVFFFAC